MNYFATSNITLKKHFIEKEDLSIFSFETSNIFEKFREVGNWYGNVISSNSLNELKEEIEKICKYENLHILSGIDSVILDISLVDEFLSPISKEKAKGMVKNGSSFFSLEKRFTIFPSVPYSDLLYLTNYKMVRNRKNIYGEY